MTNFIEYANQIIGITVIWILAIIAVKIIEKMILKFNNRDEIFGFPIEINSKYLKFLIQAAKWLIYFISLCLSLSLVPQLRSTAYSMLAGSGIAAIVLTLISREAFTNILGGIFINLFKQFKVGSYIKIDSIGEGLIESINWHHIILKKQDQNFLVIPNNIVIGKSVEVMSWPKLGYPAEILIYLSYSANLDQAIKIVYNILEEKIFIEKNNISVNVEKLEIGYIILKAKCFVKKQTDANKLKSEANLLIKKELELNSIRFADFTDLKIS